MDPRARNAQIILDLSPEIRAEYLAGSSARQSVWRNTIGEAIDADTEAAAIAILDGIFPCPERAADIRRAAGVLDDLDVARKNARDLGIEVEALRAENAALRAEIAALRGA